MGSKRLLNSTARRESERLKESEPLLRDRNKPRISGWRRRLSFAPFIARLEDAGGRGFIFGMDATEPPPGASAFKQESRCDFSHRLNRGDVIVLLRRDGLPSRSHQVIFEGCEDFRFEDDCVRDAQAILGREHDTGSS